MQKLQSGGKPSTWFPPGVLEQRSCTYQKMYENIQRHNPKHFQNILNDFKEFSENFAKIGHF